MGAVKIGVIGCGLRPTMMFEHIPGIGDEMCIAAIFDPKTETMQAFRDRYAPEATLCRDYRDVIATEGIEWVFIASPNSFHR